MCVCVCVCVSVCLCVCVCACVVQPGIFSNNFIISCGACVGPHTNKCRLMSRLVIRNMVFACLGLCIACFYNPHNTPTTPPPSLFVVWSFAMCHLLFIICLLMFVYYFIHPHNTPTHHTHTISTPTDVAVDPADRELQPGAGRARLGLALGFASFTTTGHDEIDCEAG